MAEDTTNDLSRNINTLREHLATLEGVLVSMRDINSDSRTRNLSGVQESIRGLEAGNNRISNKKRLHPKRNPPITFLTSVRSRFGRR